MSVILLIGSILAATANGTLLHLLAEKKIKYNALLFNIGVSLVWLVGLLCYNNGILCINRYMFSYGVLYGLTLCGFLFFKMQAMVNGPLSLTALIGSSSFVVTVIFNVIYWKEPVGFFEISGVAAMLTAVLMITWKPREKDKVKVAYKIGKRQKISLKWKMYCLFFFIFSSATGIIFRFHQHIDAAHTDEMMIFSSLIVMLLLSVVFLASYRHKVQVAEVESENTLSKTKNRMGVLIFILLCGIMSCVYNRLNIYLTGVMLSNLFFPVFNGGVVILASLTGIILFKEKPTTIQVFGMILGVFAIMLVSRFFGLF